MDKKLLYILGRPLSPLYGMLMQAREYCYKHNVFTTTWFAVPVISVGNLTLGGTGKTPMVQYLARLLQHNGYRPAIVSRGYGGKAGEPVNLVSDGKQIYLEAWQCGDEPRFLAETLPGVPVLTGVVRKLPIARAVEMGADVVLLDDGFQHMAVGRNCNLVLFQADVLAGNSRIFPGGDLREPVTALKRADCFILTHVREDNRARAVQFAELLQSKIPGKKVYLASYLCQSLVTMGGGRGFEEVGSQALPGGAGYGFSGIAHPEIFHANLKQQDMDLAGFVSYPDHQPYTQALVDKLTRKAAAEGAAFLVTTEKDMVKLQDCSLSLPLFALRMQVSLDQEFDRNLLLQLTSLGLKSASG